MLIKKVLNVSICGEPSKDIFNQLVTNGADIDADDDYGITVLDLACGFYFDRIIRSAIQKFANIKQNKNSSRGIR